MTHVRLYDNSRCYVRFIYDVRLIRRCSVYSYCRSSPRGFGGRAVVVSEKIMEVAFSMHPCGLPHLRQSPGETLSYVAPAGKPWVLKGLIIHYSILYLLFMGSGLCSHPNPLYDHGLNRDGCPNHCLMLYVDSDFEALLNVVVLSYESLTCIPEI
jgi:hypothetical protein